MVVKLKEKQFDCIQFKETLQAAMWEKSKAVNLEEYVAWLKNETSKIGGKGDGALLPNYMFSDIK